jgi:hypothetical protein
MAINVAPKGSNVGYTAKAPVEEPRPEGEFDPLTQKLLKVINKGNEMEDSTENAIKKINQARQDTIGKVQNPRVRDD